MSSQRNISTLQKESKDICPVHIQVRFKSKMKRFIVIFLTLETRDWIIKKLQLDFLTTEPYLRVSLLEIGLLLKRKFIKIKQRRIVAGKSSILLEKLKIFINHGFQKIILHQTKLSFYKKNMKETALRRQC